METINKKETKEELLKKWAEMIHLRDQLEKLFKQGNYKVEWQLHYLNGSIDMIEKIVNDYLN